MYDLEERTLKFSKNILIFCMDLRKSSVSNSIIDQLVRSSGSIGANYIEANEALSKKDFLHRVKISRKEAKETVFWLKNLKVIFDREEVDDFIDEANQLKKILSAIIEKSKV